MYVTRSLEQTEQHSLSGCDLDETRNERHYKAHSPTTIEEPFRPHLGICELKYKKVALLRFPCPFELPVDTAVVK